MGLPDDAMDDSDAESRCPRDSDGELAADMDVGFMGSLEPEGYDEIAGMLLQQLGAQGRRYRRESRRALRGLVSEIYSPPRITTELRRGRYKYLAPGLAFDVTVKDPDDGQPWDFTRRDKREKARRLIREYKPLLLIGSPMCTAFSTFQNINVSKFKDPEAKQRAYVQACMHMNFVASLYWEQLEAGRYFLHEHPRWASSWELKAMKDLKRAPSVDVVQGDQCQYGAVAPHGPRAGDPVFKPTGFMSNSPEILRQLSRRCTGQGGACSRPMGGRHVTCSGSLTAEMAKYPRDLCRAVLKGITAQLRADRQLKPGCFGVQAADDEEEIAQQLYGPAQGYSGRYRDDLTGQVLRDDLVKAARMKELAFFHSKGVWVKVPREKAKATTGKNPISVRWVDVNKGDEAAPNYRSRLVARQIKALDRTGDSYFAPAPPLEALRTVLSLAMTRCGSHRPIWDPTSPQRTQVSFVDITRAYFNAKVDRDAAPCFVELPPEDADSGKLCGELLRHMYGTRSAADGWQEEYSTFLVRLGFRQGMGCPNVFRHETRGIATSVHGDDFTSSGPADALDWLEDAISQEYEATRGPRLGPGPNDAKEARALNRMVIWRDDHIEYEADPRQAERLVDECGLNGAKPMATPGVKLAYRDHEADTPLQEKLHTAFRGAAARGNYLSADRIDCQYACKEICRSMAAPSDLSWKALKRLCRFLNGKPRLMYIYRRQEVDSIDVYVDADWAGCPKTRKSTSGGCVMLGRHTIKHWSSTQPSVSLSSGEAEFYGVVRGTGQGLGYQSLLKDLGMSVPLRVWTDSSAALGICSRQGLGKLRHLDTHTLWVQLAVRSKRVVLKKILGEENPADLLTKHNLTQERIVKLVDLFDCRYREGRAETAPKMRVGRSNKMKISEADQHLDAVIKEEEITEDDGYTPRMPHTELSSDELEAQYPSLEAPEELELEDLGKLEKDTLYAAGMQVVQQILDEMAVAGRTRRAQPEPPPQRPGAAAAK